MSRYATARSLLSVITALGWISIGVGLAAALITLRQTGLVPALALAAGGILPGVGLLALAQMALAQLDTADNTEKLVDLLTQIERRTRPDGLAPAVPAPYGNPAARQRGHIKNYNGRAIIRESSGVSVDGRPFANVIEAERWIDGDT